MPEAPEVKVKVSGEDTGVASAIRQLSQELRDLKNAEKEAGEGALTLGKAFEAFVAIREVLKLEELGKEAFDAAINIGKMSDKTGLSTEFLSVLHKTADDAAVSIETVDKALLKGVKTITEFQQGNEKAAKGMALLNIQQKDFIGLNSDQKMRLVVERLGGMEKGFQKATAASDIFGKGVSDITILANSLAGQGFDKATESTRKLGLLLSQDMTDDFRAAKASMQELKDAGQGMATQFEAGLLPALSDVAESFLDALGDDGAGGAFKKLGGIAGTTIRYIVFGLESIGVSAGHAAAEIAEVFDFAFNHTKKAAQITFAQIGAFFKDSVAEINSEGGGGTAITTAQDALKKKLLTSKDNETKDFADRIAAIAKDADAQQLAVFNALFPSDEEAAKRKKDRASRLRTDKETAERPIENDTSTQSSIRADEDALRHQQQQDAIAHAEINRLQHQLTDELKIWESYEKQREQVEKNSYEKGTLATAEFYKRRQEDLKVETAKELEILRAQLKNAQDEVKRSEASRDSATAKRDTFTQKSKAAGGPTTKAGAAFEAQAGRDDAVAAKAEQERINGLTRVHELETQIETTTTNGQTKSLAIENELTQKTIADQQNVREFRREIDSLEGKTIDTSREEIALEIQKRTIELERAGFTQQQIQTEIEEYRQAATAVAERSVLEKKTQQDIRQFEIERRSIEIDQKNGVITRTEAEKRINALIEQRLPLLRREAQLQLQAAQKSGNQEDIAKAQNTILELDNLGKKANQLGAQVKGALSSDFQSFFSEISSGTKTVGQAFADLGISIVRSLEQIAAQMLINFAIQKISDALGIGGGGSKAAAAIATNDTIIVSNAGAAGAAAFASVMETVPFPANIALAPGIMATAVTATLSNLALGSAEHGALLDEDTIIQAHAEEMVLPKDLSGGLRKMISANHFNYPEYATANSNVSIDRSNGGDQHFGGDTYNLYHNGEDARKILDRELIPRIHEARKRGKLKINP